MKQPNLFVVISSGALVRITATNESYVAISVLTEPPMHWSMPRAQYEAEFASQYRPATEADLLGEADFDLPANAPESWRTRGQPVPPEPDPGLLDSEVRPG